VERALKISMKNDRARSKTLRISQLGLLELSRQRLRPTLGSGEYLSCPLCCGRGRVRSPETSALSVFRKIKSLVIKPDVKEVKAVVPIQVADYLLNDLRSYIVDMERQYNARVMVIGRDQLPERDIEVEAVKREGQEEAQLVLNSEEEHLREPDAGSLQRASALNEETQGGRWHSNRKKRPKTKPLAAEADEGPSESVAHPDTQSEEPHEKEDVGELRHEPQKDVESRFSEKIDDEEHDDPASQGRMGKRMTSALSSLRDFLPFS
jgi:ribonuclease E